MTSPLPEIERRPPVLAKELLASTVFLLGRLGYAIKGRAIEEFEAAGFSMYQYSVLAMVGEESRTSQATIADALGLDRSQLVGVLDDLEERGLIERRRDPGRASGSWCGCVRSASASRRRSWRRSTRRNARSCTTRC